jgi:cephalosporin hydroxylase
MKLSIDTETRTLIQQHGDTRSEFDLYSKESFELLSLFWVKVGWSLKYPHTFTWMGRPIIQLPEDMVRTQEVIYRVRPDVIVETGVAHGGSLIFYGSLCRLMGRGRVIGVDIEIRAHNRTAIEEHPLFPLITLVEGDSTDPGIVRDVKSLITPGEKVLVILDSNHSRQHVAKELEAYHDLVTAGSYIVATDGIMRELTDVPRGKAEWHENNPFEAARDFAARHPEFVLETPAFVFDEGLITQPVTYWPGAWLRRR